MRWCSAPADCVLGDVDLPSPRRRLRRTRERPIRTGKPLVGEEGEVVLSAVTYSYHALTRSCQRALTPDQIAYVLIYGTPVFRAGALFYVLRRRDITPGDLRSDEVAKLEGAVVLVSEGVITTVYRNRRALRSIRKKQKYFRGSAA